MDSSIMSTIDSGLKSLVHGPSSGCKDSRLLFACGALPLRELHLHELDTP